MPGSDATPRGAGQAEAPAHDPFVDYYARQSVSPESTNRFRKLYDLVLRVRAGTGGNTTGLRMLDVGCNTGMQAFLWAENGHLAHGIEIDAGLLRIAEQRRQERNLAVDFRQGSAVSLPWENGSMDVCLMPELLEHIGDWESCVTEGCRVLRPGGVIYLSTTNRLCPHQDEFELPMYGWYPERLRRHYEKLAVTTRPELVNHAKYPAVNWFTPYQLKRYLRDRGFSAYDHFDWVYLDDKPAPARWAVELIRRLPPLRWLAHVATPYSTVIGVRKP